MKRSIRIATFAALAALLVGCSMFDYSGIVSHKYALVYGVTWYAMNTLVPSDPPPNLSYPGNDASAIAAVLASNGYTVYSRWVDATGSVWKDGVNTNNPIGSPSTTDGVTNTGASGSGEPDAPSKANILSDINGLAGTVGPNDVLLIYFSGHGTQDTSVSPPHEYFDPYGSVMEDMVTGDPSKGQWFDYPAPSVRDDELASAFAAIKTPRKVLILDTCNSGGFIGNKLEVDTTPTSYTGGAPLPGPGTLFQAIANYASMQSSPTGLSPYGAQVLSAAGRDESCYETDYLPNGTLADHGVMTYYLWQGLLGKAADLNHDGHVTVLEAFSYAKAGIDTNWNPAYASSGNAFEPHVSGGPVDFVLF